MTGNVVVPMVHAQQSVQNFSSTKVHFIGVGVAVPKSENTGKLPVSRRGLLWRVFFRVFCCFFILDKAIILFPLQGVVLFVYSEYPNGFGQLL